MAMTTLAIAIVACCAFVVILEATMWGLFRNKMVGMSFQGGADSIFFRFFTPAHVSFTVLTHTIIVLFLLISSFLVLW